MEYCCPPWNPNKVTEIQMIEGVQKTFTSCVGGLQHLNYKKRLKQLKMMKTGEVVGTYDVEDSPQPCSELLHIRFKVTARHGVVASIPPLSSK